MRRQERDHACLQAVQAVQTRGWQRRFTIVGLCFVAFMLCNMDRVNMSIAILPMSKQYGWDSATIGLVQSSFFWWAGLTAVQPISACLLLLLSLCYVNVKPCNLSLLAGRSAFPCK